MNTDSFKELLDGYVNDTLTQEELAQFLQLVREGKRAEEFKVFIDQLFAKSSSSKIWNEEKTDAVFKNIIGAARNESDEEEGNVYQLYTKSKTSILKQVAVAASVIGLILVGSIFWFNKNAGRDAAKNEIKGKYNKGDFPPVSSKAVLTLADGSTIVLDDAKNGALVKQGNSKVIKLNGKLNYNAINSISKEIVFNTVSTPAGGQYQVELPDGSRVWLNATSSLHFPTGFSGRERRVELSGEGYFEIARNEAMPFVVSVNKAEVRVLGTHFNVMAYNDEVSLITTLLEGSVKFIKNNVTNILTPGQQSQLFKDGKVKVVNDIDVNKVVSWKNGIIEFNGVDIGNIGRKLSRWYDVDVVYTTKVEDLFYAEIPGNTKLQDVLKALELTGKVHFKLEGRKVIVIP